MTKNIEKGDDIIQLQIWDTAGTEKYNSMGQSFYRNSEACVLVFDLTSHDSFKNVESWRNDFLSSLNPPDADKYPFVLVGNKNDIKDSIQVNNDEIEAYCKEHNDMPYFSTSAKEDINLDETFNKVADLAYERNTKSEDNFVPEQKFIKVNKEEPKKKKKCCIGK